ncbi:hypothetical protein QYS49_36875 [Marivirga salinae]|uniref:Uncharacterized protein n=1 Tax=Marivirga salinarum TaxID=3059078 RepID=A0AA51N9G7_9BACT|nr:hypothetical protein [Marivirga sp. BDSF4-3]WMN11018.1 hypothetical protein QYS49_36875 [Marivirga sp. BDSF4-3]
MDRLIQIATQELGQKEISGDRHNHSTKTGDVIIFWRESPQSCKGHFGFFFGYSQDASRVYCLGRNQDNYISISLYDANIILGFIRLSLSKLLNLTLERRDQGGNSDPEKNPPPTSAISKTKKSENTWIQLVIRQVVKYLGPEVNLLEAKNLIENEKVCNDVKINSDGSDNSDVIEWINDKK